MRRLILPILLLMCIILSSCQSRDPFVGEKMIKALRSEAAEYTSARYLLVNVDTEKLEQVFTYRYNDDGTQSYLYETEADEYYAEYSDGKTLLRGSMTSYEEVPQGVDEFAVYTKKESHPYSDGQLLFYVESAISSAEQTADADGNAVYIYYYDTEKFNKMMGGSLTEFVTSYAFDWDGNFVYFRQHNVSSDGQSFTYEITMQDVNAIDTVENPFDSKE